MGKTAGLTTLRLRMPATKSRREGKKLPKWLCVDKRITSLDRKKAGISRDEHGGGEAQNPTGTGLGPTRADARRVPASTTCPVRGDLGAVDPRKTCPVF